MFDASISWRAIHTLDTFKTMDDPLPPNPYKALNVPKDASLATIRSAHRKLVLTCHPDKVHDESLKAQKSEQFQQVQQAYEILSNDTSRQRYDERSKLAELRAEMAAERGSPRMPPDSGRRSAYSPTTEVRGSHFVETRVPRRAFDDEHFSTKYQEPRSYKKYEEDYFSPPPRKSSGRVSDEKRRPRDIEDERQRDRDRDERARIAEERIRRDRDVRKAAEKAAYSERTRIRERDRRRESDTKSKSRFAQYDSESDSESDYERPRPIKREVMPKRRHEEIPRRSSKRETVDVDDYIPKEYHHVSAAEDYISKASSRVPPERRKTAFDRVPSSRAVPPPPPPPPEVGRRSSERKHSRRDPSPPRLTPKDRRFTEIVDPPQSRRPVMPSSSDPRGLKNLVSPSRESRREPIRASTISSVPEPKHPSIRRSETMPVTGSNYRRGDTAPSKSSKLKHADNHDSGYSSPGTPEYADVTPQPKSSTRYQILVEDEEEEDLPRGRVFPIPEDTRREREISPKNRRVPERPSMAPRASPGVKIPPTRSTSYAFTPETQKRPPASRTESARVTPIPSRHSGRDGPLFREVIPDYKIVHTSPKIQQDDIKFAPYAGRDRRSSEDTDRDYYPGSHRPNLSRHESGYDSRVH